MLQEEIKQALEEICNLLPASLKTEVSVYVFTSNYYLPSHKETNPEQQHTKYQEMHSLAFQFLSSPIEPKWNVCDYRLFFTVLYRHVDQRGKCHRVNVLWFEATSSPVSYRYRLHDYTFLSVAIRSSFLSSA